MKTRPDDEIVHATAEFTDREEPREAFEKNLNYVETHSDECKVLAYYGFGGIGKTRLCRELELQLGEKDYKSVYFNFEECQDCPDVLRSLGHLLTKKYKFDFSLVNYALYLYELKQGKDIQRPEVVQALQENSFVGAVIDAVQLVPVVGGVGGWLLKYADKLQSSVRDAIYRNQAEIQKMDGYMPEDLRRRLPYYFAKDLNRNLAAERKPLVIFLDTYEQLTNMIYNSAQARAGDEWLYGVDGVIPRVPNVLWVIAGQAKLKWAEYDADWNNEDNLEQHRIGTLGEEDIRHFLKSVGITDAQLVDVISQQTGGVPVHLDLCVETYYMIKQKGDQPGPSDFAGGVEVLTKRFIGNLQGKERDLLELLACMETWQDEDLLDPMLNVSDAVYRRIKQLAFIARDGKGYYIHKAVRDVLYRGCGELVKHQFDQFLTKRLEDPKVSTVDKKRFRAQKVRLTLSKLETMEPEEGARQFQALYGELRPELLRYVDGEYDFGYFSTLYSLLKRGAESLPISGEIRVEMLLLEFSAWVNQGDFMSAKQLVSSIQSWDIRKFGPSTKLFYYKSLGDYYKGERNWRHQLQCHIECRSIAEGMPGKEQDALQALKSMAVCYTRLNDFEKAQDSGESFLERQRSVLEADPTDEQRLELVDGYVEMANCMRRQALSEPAAKYLDQAEALLDVCENQERIRCIDLRASVMLYRGDLMRAYGYFDLAQEQYLAYAKLVETLYELCPCEAWRRHRGIAGNRMSLCLLQSEGNLDEALRYAEESLSIAQEGYSRQRNYDMFNMLCAAVIPMAAVYRAMPGKLPQAIQICEELLTRLGQEDSEGDSGEAAFTLYGDLAFSYRAAKDKGNMERCLQKQGEIVAASYPNEKNYFEARKQSLWNERCGIFYREQGHPGKAIPYYEKALRLDKAFYEAAPDPLRAKTYASDCMNLADLNIKMKNQAKALEYLLCYEKLRKTIYEAGPSVRSLRQYKWAVEAIEQFHREQNDPEQALPWAELRFRLNKKIHEMDPSETSAGDCVWSANALQLDLFRLKRYGDSVPYYQDALAVMSSCEDTQSVRASIMSVHFHMADALYRSGRLAEALEHVKLSISHPDEISAAFLSRREDFFYRISMELETKRFLKTED